MCRSGILSPILRRVLIAAGMLWMQSAALHAAATATTQTDITEWVEESPLVKFGYPEIAPSESIAKSMGRTVQASFGPFHVVGRDRAELVGTIETGTPAQFGIMLSLFPGIKQIDIIDCPGTDDDTAIFSIARMIRKANIATNVPNGGSVRSGGVELFLAGVRRHADPNAEFVVHSWRDEDGLEADDVAANDPLNLEYINYYREIGMDEKKARAFYALTNSVPHDDALYLKAGDIAAYVPLD
jgi:hypothetical protein